MTTTDIKVAKKFKTLLQGKVKLHQAILFGSRARGDADPESDMDVLVVVNGLTSTKIRDVVSDCAWEAGFAAGIVVVPIVVSRQDWETGPEKSSLLAISVREEGVPL